MSFFEQTNKGILLKIRLSPKARREGVESVYTDANGVDYLKIAVNAPPVDGKANKALIALLAKRFKIAKSRFELVSGLTDRTKTILITGNEDVKQLIMELNRCPKSSGEM